MRYLMNLVVAYDIVEGPKRTKLSRLLCKYGVRLQKSVFLVKVKRHEMPRFTRDIENITGPGGDVAMFRLCEGCTKTAARLSVIPEKIYVF
jgi:CRISPR-associated endonuclease Cas2